MSDESANTTFKGEIIVASQIVDYLSSGLYHTPAACLKELINNSYDADARRVDVLVKPDADRIIVADDGDGMDRGEFERHFKRVSESHKRDDDDKTATVRPKIGKIGIGFIAANELCEVMEIFSTKRGSSELLHVKIDFREIRKPMEERRRSNGGVVKADYEGEVLTAPTDAHFTQVFLTETRGPAKTILASARAQGPESGATTPLTLYGKNASSVVATLAEPSLASWSQFDAYSETMLQVGLNVPVRYYLGWIPERYEPQVSDLVSEVAHLKFEVYYDGTELGKPIVLRPPEGEVLISRFQHKGREVSANGYFYAQHGTVRPFELQGLLVRIRHAAVGEYDSTFWGFSRSEGALIQKWISAEVWADDRLESAMNIDRRTLRHAHPAYVELRDAVHLHLREVIAQARSGIYQVSSTARKASRQEDAEQSIVHLAETLDPAVREYLTTWLAEMHAGSRPAIRALSRRFSPVEVLEIVRDATGDVLTPEDREALLISLIERLKA